MEVKKLNLSSYKSLEALTLYYTKLSGNTLSLSPCKKLKELSVTAAKLQLTKNTKLQIPEVTDCSLKTLDLTGCTKLTNLHIRNNPLNTLTVSKNSSSTSKKLFQKAVRENGGKLLYRP